jgi:hypothetical protein
MTGPLILITLGVLFLLNNLYPGDFPIGRMWPVVLIVIGLVKIFEYFERSNRSEPADRGQRRPPGGGVEGPPPGGGVSDRESKESEVRR